MEVLSVDTMPIDFIVSENKNAYQIVHVSSLFCYFLVSFDLSL